MRALVIGFPKSGTTTLHRACKKSGLRSAHWRTPDGYCGPLIYESFAAGKDPLEKLANYDVVTQADFCIPKLGNCWPNLDFDVLSAVRRYHPECVFILNRRDPQKIINSINRWRAMRQRFTRSDIIGLPKGVGGKDEELRAWIEGHYAACASRFSADPYYLDFDIEADDARERLSRALGVELRWWGIANDTRSNEAVPSVKRQYSESAKGNPEDQSASHDPRSVVQPMPFSTAEAKPANRKPQTKLLPRRTSNSVDLA